VLAGILKQLTIRQHEEKPLANGTGIAAPAAEE
jgi:hypothetical protein